MKTRNLLLGAMGLLVMASCSKDELVSVNHDGDEIAFNVVTNASTRVYTGENGDGGVYCNNNRPRTFYVWATTADDGKTFIEGDKVQYRNTILTTGQAGKQPRMTGGIPSGPALWMNSSLRYWPGDRSLNFYAAANALKGDANYAFNWNNTDAFSAPTIDVTVPTDVAAQKDLLYAVKTDQNKDTNNGVVSLNFRHALSQIVFTAQTPNPKLYVKIEGVSICNVMSKNTFTYPDSNTENNLNGHPAPAIPAAPDYTDGSWGQWAEAGASEPTEYAIEVNPAVEFNKEAPAAENTPVSLSGPMHSYTVGEATHTAEYNTNAMLLLPQTSTAWNPKAEPYVQPGNAAQTGTYFLVKCLIFNIAGDRYDPATDICVWGNKAGEGDAATYTAKEVAIPVKLTWDQGKKYIYNFVFGVLGGYNPDDPDPDPDLVPIDFTVTVDEFAAVDNDMLEELVNMKR